MMRKDPIVEEVRQVRQAYARRFNYNLRAISADLHEKEQQHPERLVRYDKRTAAGLLGKIANQQSWR